MEEFADYLNGIDNPQHRARTEEVLQWVAEKFSDLEPKFAWKQPMYTDHGTFIIGFSISKQHLAVAPEKAGMNQFAAQIKQAGYDQTKLLFRIQWDQEVDYALLEQMIMFNIIDKADCSTFWRA